MEILNDKYSITELSQRLNLTDHTLRYYEKEFNIHVPKDGRGRRFYTPELANLMFQIKQMRTEGLEIKAIKKILQSENIIKEPPPVVLDDGSTSLMPLDFESKSDLPVDIRNFFNNFKEELTESVSAEVATVKEHFSREINKTKLELGACVENSARKLEAKLDKHFQEVDKYLTGWRERKKGGILGKVFRKS